MESTEARFVAMIIDRLHAVETENDRLKRLLEELNTRLEARCPAIYLTPHTKYTSFNDGWSFFWDLSKRPTMVDERDDKDDLEDEDFLPLDDAHWDAVVFPSETWIQLGEWPDVPFSKKRFRVGRAGEPVTVRTMVDEINAQILALGDAVRCESCGDCGTYQGFEQTDDAFFTDMVLNVVH